MKFRRRTGKLVTPLLAAATAIAFTAPGAGAAGSGPPNFAGVANALALDLNVTAPSALIGAVTGGSNNLTQKISLTNSELDSTGLIKATAELLSGLLNQGKVSNADGSSSAEEAIIPQQNIAGILDLGVGTTKFTADLSQNLTDSFSELANVRLSLAPLFAGGDVPADVTATLDGALADVTNTVEDLTGDLNLALDDVTQTLEDTLGQTVELPVVEPEDLPSVPDLTSIDLVNVQKIWSNSVVKTVDDVITAESVSGIVDASLLGGLIEVPAFQYKSIAGTAGKPGTAFADTEVTQIAVRVAGSDVVKVAGNQLTVGDVVLDLDDPAMSGLPVDDILAPVNDVLNQLLNVVGLSVAQGEGITEVAEDGSFAKASTSAFRLSLKPLHAVGEDSLLAITLRLLPTDAAVTAAGAPPEQVPAPDVKEPAAAPPALPRTGGGAVALLMGALALGGAGALRRMS